MAAPHAHNVAKEDPTSPKRSSIGSPFDFLLTLFNESPSWVRTVVVLGIFAAAAIGVYKWIATSSQSSKTQPSGPSAASSQPGGNTQSQGGLQPYSLDKGQQVNAPGNRNNDPGNVVATQRISDDDEHFRWHATHEQHEPDWNVISKVDDDNLVEYKYYKDTDHCILVLRKHNGDLTPYWAREAVFNTNSTKNANPHPEEPGADITDLLVGTAFASPQESYHPEPHLQPVQMGCANPHPGAFQWWWGQPSDQCWSPMYRRFQDGCTHHQMFNRCYNTWDPNIYWDHCTGGPQHF